MIRFVCKHFFIIISLIFLLSCILNKAGNDENTENKTNAEGKYSFQSDFYGKTVEVSVSNEYGYPVENLEVHHNQIDSTLFIAIYDNTDKYLPSIIFTNPYQLNNLSKIAYSQKTQILPIIVIGVGAIKIGIVAYSAYKLFKNGYELGENIYEISEFAIDNYENLDLGINKTALVTTVGEFENLYINTFGAGKCIVNLAFSLITAGHAHSAKDAFIKSFGLDFKKVQDIGSDFIYNFLKDQLQKSWNNDNINENTKIEIVYYPLKSTANALLPGSPFDNVIEIYPYSHIDNVPPQVNNFLTSGFLDSLSSKGMTIHKGLNPPNITGYYYLDSWTNLETGKGYTDYSYKFANQTYNLGIEVSSTSKDGSAVSNGQGAFISGTGNNFTVYVEMNSESDESTHIVKMKTATLLSGTLTTDGIKDFKKGFIMTYKSNDINDDFMDVGDARVIYESDGLASRVSTYPYSSSLTKLFAKTMLKNELHK